MSQRFPRFTRQIACLGFCLLAVVLLASHREARAQEPDVIKSPNGQVELRLALSDGRPRWSLGFEGDDLLQQGELGIHPVGGELESLETDYITHREHRGSFDMLWGKFASYQDDYNEVSWQLQEAADGGRTLRVVFRVYDQGVAFRYEFPEDGSWPKTFEVKHESTEFRFAGDYTGWSYNGEHSPVGPQPLSKFAQLEEVRPPFTIECGPQTYLAILEAAVYDHAPFDLAPTSGEAHCFGAQFARSQFKSGGATSWRVVLVGNEPGDLLVAPLLYCLNPPCEIADPDWIRPGLAMWDWRAWGARTDDGFTYELDMASWRRMIDFASENGVEYLLLDANWYGPEFDAKSDPRISRDHLVIQPDPNKPQVIRKPAPADWDDPIDAPGIIRYGKERNVGILLYINDVARKNYPFEETLALYHEWGAAGIKYGFMKASGQQKVRETREIVRLCAKYELVCDFHDGPIIPSGDERTYPNYLTREFCHAQADSLRSFSPTDFCKMAFVNMLAGPLDMSNGLFSLTDAHETRPRIFQPVESTVAAEAARVLVTFTGLATLIDTPEAYREKADLFDFIRRLPMTWDETRILSGAVGSYISTARRSGTTWYVGTVTNEEPRTLHLPLDFLEADQTYKLTLYEDTPDTHYEHNREAYRVREQQVTSGDVIEAVLAPGGGHCMLLEPK